MITYYFLCEYSKYSLLYKIDLHIILATVFDIKFNKCAVVSKINVDAYFLNCSSTYILIEKVKII